MYSERTAVLRRAVLAMLLGLCAGSVTAAEAAATLHVRPVHCVALHQGQQCYFDAEVHWRATAIGDYCLFRQDDSEPLHCWLQHDGAEIELPLHSAETVVFELRDDEQVLATAQVEVAWVYQSRRRAVGSWRLF